MAVFDTITNTIGAFNEISDLIGSFMSPKTPGKHYEFQMFGIYFHTSKQTVRLPMNPSELTIRYDGDNTNYNLISLGEVVIPRNAKLATVEMSSFFPRNAFMAGTASDSWYKPEFYVDFFRMLQRNKVVFLFIVNRYDDMKPVFDTSFKAVVSSFEITDRGGESGDIYFNLSIQEYRNTEPQSVEKAYVNEENDTTYLAKTKQRDVDNAELIVGDMVTVSGPAFETDDQLTTALAMTKKILTKANGVVQRVLPPSAQPAMSRVLVDGIGWVDKADCVKSNVQNTEIRMNQIYGSNQ